MAVQIVMDPTGDTRHEFNTSDAAAVAQAERRFKELTRAGLRRRCARRRVVRSVSAISIPPPKRRSSFLAYRAAEGE
jgi:hypothetical protein